MIVPIQTRASVTVFLDTRPPRLVFEADDEVEPPDEWVLVITADEAIGDAPLAFRDSAGYLHSVGYSMVNDRTMRVVLPSVSLASEWGTLEGWVTDTTCNATPIAFHVYVRRPRAFDVVISFGSSLDASVNLDGPFEVESDLSHSLDASFTLRGPFEVESSLRVSFDVEVSFVGSNG